MQRWFFRKCPYYPFALFIFLLPSPPPAPSDRAKALRRRLAWLRHQSRAPPYGSAIGKGPPPPPRAPVPASLRLCPVNLALSLALAPLPTPPLPARALCRHPHRLRSPAACSALAPSPKRLMRTVVPEAPSLLLPTAARISSLADLASAGRVDAAGGCCERGMQRRPKLKDG
ncbi:hypothetical protein GUJ93_ZPchr0013g34770 [Zizania palustris]|uniref:Uncharacterized protein n=1 Tax=Zizania palustris TaxID=103762 RepID=A0A8J6C2G8_ZIZPA|nr:hypothetical protein GUJ93_ZPchr0013g34770 [Zizania palustris]